MKNSLRLWNVLLSLAMITVPVLICGGLLYFYLRDELDNRRLISFMNFEQLGHRFDRSFEEFDDFVSDSGSLRFQRIPLALIPAQATADQATIGILPEGFHSRSRPAGRCEIQSLSNISYLSCPLLLPSSGYQEQPVKAGYYWGVWRMTARDFAIFADAAPNRMFLVNGQGKIIFQSDSKQPQNELLSKPFVQEFIRLPLSKQASAPYTDHDTETIGFAMALPHSQVTLFVESPATLIFAALWKPTIWIIAGLFFGVAFLSLLTQIAVATMREQIASLAAALRVFAVERQIPTRLNPQSFLSELAPLIASLNDSTLQIREMLDAQNAGTTAAEAAEKP